MNQNNGYEMNHDRHESPVLPTIHIILFLLHTLIGFYAIYISFKVNKNLWGITRFIFQLLLDLYLFKIW